LKSTIDNNILECWSYLCHYFIRRDKIAQRKNKTKNKIKGYLAIQSAFNKKVNGKDAILDTIPSQTDNTDNMTIIEEEHTENRGDSLSMSEIEDVDFIDDDGDIDVESEVSQNNHLQDIRERLEHSP